MYNMYRGINIWVLRLIIIIIIIMTAVLAVISTVAYFI